MAPLPHNNTAILYVDYTQGGVEHTFEVRVDTLSEIEAIETVVGAFLTSLGSLVGSATITGTRGGAEGSNITLPFPISSLTGVTFGSGTTNAETVPFFLNFVGRSVGGRRVSLAIFGLNTGLSNYRLTTSEETEIAAAVAILNGSTGTFLAIDGLQAIWYPYANTGVNAYWQRQQRA
jgi:hypothetical protein